MIKWVLFIFSCILLCCAFKVSCAQDSIVESDSTKYDLPGKIICNVTEQPEFPGGYDSIRSFLSRTLRYPDTAEKQGLEDTVVIRFTIGKKGEVLEPAIKNGMYPSLNQEALRVIRAMPDWRPATQRGRPVEVTLQLPLIFTLD